MTCAWLGSDALHGYLDHTLPPDVRAGVDAHSATCETCREVLAVAARALVDDEEPPVDDLAPVSESSYEVDVEIARGGIGRVSRAFDRRLGRNVALKELHDPSPEAHGRFVREALITARLEHPAIVPVHEAGRWPDGEPFYAMKLVSGETLAQRIKRAPTLRERLGLLPSMIAVSEAIAYAHSREVIHRDLKPANVLLGQFGETVVVDWGLAKHLTESDDGPTGQAGGGGETMTGTVLGTPAYMPPEQARGEPTDRRADVYALGAILYELLAGVPPYDCHGDHGAVLRAPPIPVEERERGVPRDLTAIVRKAMAREPSDRYPTAQELVADLRQFQTGQLVGAHEYSRWSLVLRWLRRNRLPAAITAIAVGVFAIGGGLAITRIIHAREVAETAELATKQALADTEARNAELVLLQAKAIVDRDPTRALAWLKAIPAEAPLWEDGRRVAVDAVSRGFSRHVWRNSDHHTQIRMSPDGRFLVTGGARPGIRIYDLAGGPVRTIEIGKSLVVDLAFADDGTLAASDDDGQVVVMPIGDHATPRVVRPAARPGDRTYVAISPDAHRLAVTRYEGTGNVDVIDLVTGETRTLPGGRDGTRAVAMSPDGALVAVASVDRVLRVYDLATGASRELSTTDVASNLVFSHDGRVIAAELEGIREFTLATGNSRLLPFPRMRYISVAITPDDSLVIAAGYEGPIHALDVASGQIATLLGHDAIVTDLAVSVDGKLVASVAMDRTTRLWEVPTRRDRILGRVAGKARGPALSPDGTELAVGTDAGEIVRLPVAGPPRTLAVHRDEVFDIAYAPDGRAIASQSRDRTIRVTDLATGANRVVAETAAWTSFGRLMFSPDGRWLAATLDLETLALFDAATLARGCTFGKAGFNLARAFSPDGRTIAFTANEQVRLGDLATCTSRVLYAHDASKSAYQIVFSPDGKYVVSASDDATLGVHDLRTGETRRLRGHDADVMSVAISPDGRYVASGGSDRTVRIWDIATGTSRVLRGHDTPVASMRYAADGRLASIGLDDKIRVWDPATGAGGVLVGHRDRVTGIAYARDGRLVSTGSDGTVRSWDPDPLQGLPVAPAALLARLGMLTSATHD